jgi:hypothetical protein
MTALTPEQRAEVSAIARETAVALLAERGEAFVSARTEALGERDENWPYRSGPPASDASEHLSVKIKVFLDPSDELDKRRRDRLAAGIGILPLCEHDDGLDGELGERGRSLVGGDFARGEKVIASLLSRPLQTAPLVLVHRFHPSCASRQPHDSAPAVDGNGRGATPILPKDELRRRS